MSDGECADLPPSAVLKATYEGLSAQAYLEFCDVLDYIWKTPEFLRSQIGLEVSKLEEYFPVQGDPKEEALILRLREARWRDESRKLGVVFPYLTAVGNLFTSVSLFETYCLMLCRELEARVSVATQRLYRSDIHKNQDVTVDFSDVQI
ncbi:MAG TPA: hypothetical protein VM434_09075, partial [Beijerinckiaceae bacterium]|nr:hypothetical protein [Beijerinckiaceae bacterium]